MVHPIFVPILAQWLATVALPSPTPFAPAAELSCQRSAELMYAIAESAGERADAAYEDAFATCAESDGSDAR